MHINLIFYSQQISFTPQSFMVILASFLLLTFSQVEPVINMGTKEDHAMFRQESFWGSVFLTKAPPVFSTETDLTNTGSATWPNIAGGTTTKAISLETWIVRDSKVCTSKQLKQAGSKQGRSCRTTDIDCDARSTRVRAITSRP